MRVKLRSTNPLDPLIIDPKYYDVPEDLQIMVEGKRSRMLVIHTKHTKLVMSAAYLSYGCKHCVKTSKGNGSF